ncbi:MAG: hypothetical protein V4760_13075 [Bdellovibrionota bacterium]
MNTGDWEGPLPQRALWVAGHRFDTTPKPVHQRRNEKLSFPEVLLLSAALLALLLM